MNTSASSSTLLTFTHILFTIGHIEVSDAKSYLGWKNLKKGVRNSLQCACNASLGAGRSSGSKLTHNSKCLKEMLRYMPLCVSVICVFVFFVCLHLKCCAQPKKEDSDTCQFGRR